MDVSLAHMLPSPWECFLTSKRGATAQIEPSGGSDGVSGPDCHTDLLQSPVSPILGCPAQSSECEQTVNCRQVQA